MKKLALTGVLSALAVLALVSITTPARTGSDGMPIGTVLAWAGNAQSLPAGWMLCNGKALSKTVYADLFAVIGTSWGSTGDRFNLPDLRGRFLRGDDAGTGRDPDAKKRAPSMPGGSASGVGSVQEDSIQNHTHDQTVHRHLFENYAQTAYITPTGGTTQVLVDGITQFDQTEGITANIKGAAKYSTKSQIKAGEESRPKNAAMNFIIKVK